MDVVLDQHAFVLKKRAAVKRNLCMTAARRLYLILKSFRDGKLCVALFENFGDRLFEFIEAGGFDDVGI